MKTIKILSESNYQKVEQTVIKDNDSVITYIITYRKELHVNYPNGYKWIVA